MNIVSFFKKTPEKVEKKEKIPRATKPIKDKKLLKELVETSKRSKRDYIMFQFFLYSGLRVSDLINLKVKDVLKDTISITEKKTGKTKTVVIPSRLKELVKKHYEDEYYICCNKRIPTRPLSKSGVTFVFKEYSRYLGIQLSPHTLRKTFGYTHYKQFNDLAQLSKIYNHSNIANTLIYIGIVDEEIEKSIESLKFY